MKNLFIKLLLVVVLTSVFISSGNQALLAQQNDIQIIRLSTEILPEYDTSDILVLNAIQIKNNSDKDYSGELRWIVPNGSTTHIVIDEKDSQNQLPYSLAQNNGNTEMVWKLKKPLKAGEISTIHLEYYYNNLQGNVDKNFSFELVQPYPINFGQIYFYQPKTATNFKVSPEIGSPQSGEFTYYQTSYSDLSPGQKKSFSVAYTKSDPNPSVTKSQNGSSGQPQAPDQNNVTSPKSSNSKIGIYIMAGLAIVILLVVAKIISNYRKLAQMGDYEMDQEDFEDDFENDFSDEYPEDDDTDDTNDIDDTDDSRDNNTQASNLKLSGEKAKLIKDLKAGRITEDEYLLMLDELKQKDNSNCLF